MIEHWLNGERVLSFDYTAPKWAEYVDLLGARGGDLTGRNGTLWLQDHGQDVWFRNLRLRVIPEDEVITPDPDFIPMPVTGVALEKEEARVKKMLGAAAKSAKAKAEKYAAKETADSQRDSETERVGTGFYCSRSRIGL